MNNSLDQEKMANENLSEENKSALPQEETATVSSEKEDESPKTEITEDTTAVPGSKAEIIEKLASAVNKDVTKETKAQIETLKQAYYKIRRAEVEEARKAFLEEGGSEEAFMAPKDDSEAKLKEFLAIYKEKKAALAAESERTQEANLQRKKEIIAQIKNLTEVANEDFYKAYPEFKKLQQEWRETKKVPFAAESDLWKEYQLYSEAFYDLQKINYEMRDYDFKKNLELKQAVVEAVKRLESEEDVLSAFHHLQKLQQEWREIGPVAKELRDESWEKFKEASSVIFKRHQDHFGGIRSMEQRNLEEKTLLCEEAENINYDELLLFKDWDAQYKQVVELQEKWKTIGFAPKKANTKISERFRNACDLFFKKKSEFYKSRKSNKEENQQKKEALCEQVEALKDSEDWKDTTEQLIDLQQKWKTVGRAPKKDDRELWERFTAACNHFFERKNQRFSSRRTEETENLKRKKEIIKKITEISEALPASEATAIIREQMNEWNTIGFVPYREKDKIYDSYRAAIDAQYDRLKLSESERRLQSFRTSMSEISSETKAKGKLLKERERLMRTYERLKNDVQTYENNIGFLSVSSKGGGGLVKEMNRKVDSLKDELKLIVKKIEVIDENFNAGKTK